MALDPFAPIIVVEHAVRRFRERVAGAGDLTYLTAQRTIREQFRAALVLDRYTVGMRPGWMRANGDSTKYGAEDVVWAWPEETAYCMIGVPRSSGQIVVETVIVPKR